MMEIFHLPPKVRTAAKTLIDWLEAQGVKQEEPQHHAEMELLYSLVKLHDGNWHEQVQLWNGIRENLERYFKLVNEGRVVR